MADSFNVNRGLDSKIKLQPINPGSIWITEDGQSLYLDSKDGLKRIQITDVIDLSVESPTSYFPNKIYIDGYKIKIYNSEIGNLETISDLKNKVLESENEFIYDTSDISKATLIDDSSPIIGTIVIDKNGDIGIVTSIAGNLLSISVIANNKSKNVLTGYDIYFDSNYDGNQIGTFGCPFSNADNLFTTCKVLLENDAIVTIHIKSNGIFNALSEIQVNLKNVIFIGDMSAKLNLSSFKYCTLNNIIFKNIMFTDTITFKNASKVIINDCTGNVELIFDSCNDITCINSNIGNLNITGISTIDVINSNLANGLNCYGGDGIISVDNSTIQSLISSTNSIYTTNEYTFILNNVVIDNNVDCNCKNITFNSGYIKFNGTIKINAEEINLGTFNFNNVTPTLTGNVNKLSGLSSDQVYDKIKNRAYGIPNDTTLKAHLDKISEFIQDNKNDVDELKTSGLSQPFSSKSTFSNTDALTDGSIANIKVGNVFKYVGATIEEYRNNINLELTKIISVQEPIDIGGESVLKNYYDFYFNLKNASYYCKFNEPVYAFHFKNEVSKKFTLSIKSVSLNSLIARISEDNADESVIPFEDSESIEKTYWESCYYTQILKIYPNDRLVYIGDFYDKLSDNSNKEDENYYIKDDFAQLASIFTDDTRPVGVLAYVKNENKIYQWKYSDDEHTVLAWSELLPGIDDKLLMLYYRTINVFISDAGYFIVNNTGEKITGLTNVGMNQRELTIPYKINGVKITTLYNESFADCPSLTTVVIPYTVTTISQRAFANCPSLKNIKIPSSVTFIDSTAFEGCSDFTIYCEQGSYAETFAKANNIPIVYTDMKSLVDVHVTTITVPADDWVAKLDDDGIPYYTMNIIDSILTSDGYPVSDVVLSDDIIAARLQAEEYKCIDKITVNDGSIDLYCFDTLPLVSFQIRIQIMGLSENIEN